MTQVPGQPLVGTLADSEPGGRCQSEALRRRPALVLHITNGTGPQVRARVLLLS